MNLDHVCFYCNERRDPNIYRTDLIKRLLLYCLFTAASREIKQDLEKAREEIEQLKSERYKSPVFTLDRRELKNNSWYILKSYNFWLKKKRSEKA